METVPSEDGKILCFGVLPWLEQIGLRYTWTNKQEPPSLIMERLDRVYVTNGWEELFPNGIIIHEPILYMFRPCNYYL